MKRSLDEETGTITRPAKKAAVETHSWLDHECDNAACNNLKLAYMYEKKLLNAKLEALKKQSELEKQLIQANAERQILEAKQQETEVRRQLKDSRRMIANLTKSQNYNPKVEDKVLVEQDREPGELVEPDSRVLRRGHRFSWLTKSIFEVPTVILQSVASFLPDDTLFRFREINTMFYGTYYNQKVERDMSSRYPWRTTRPFNAIRAMKLALRGRRFGKVRFIKTDHAERTSDRVPSEVHLSTLTPINFPFLDSIYFGQLKRKNSVRYLPGHPMVEAISTPIYNSMESYYINQEKFPSLKLLEIQSVACEACVMRHSNLEIINFFDCKKVRWKYINKEMFPRLKRVTKKYSGRIPRHIVFFLEASGVIVDEVDLEDF